MSKAPVGFNDAIYMIANPAMDSKYFGLRRSQSAMVPASPLRQHRHQHGNTDRSQMIGINAAKPFVPPLKNGAQKTAGRFISWDRPDFLVDATRPITDRAGKEKIKCGTGPPFVGCCNAPS
jgi:hypothetical protein